MRNAIVTILGQKGAGKTTFARYLYQKTPRITVVDRFLEYEGAVATGFEGAVDYLAANWRGPFRLVCRFRSDVHHRELFRFLAYTAERCPTLPQAVLVEEADFFASPVFMEPPLEALYRYGRHWSISLCAVARHDTDLHRQIIGNSDVLVLFRSRKFSAAMRERFSATALAASLRLETLRPGVEPVKGRHFVTFPDEADPVAEWVGGLAPVAPGVSGVAPAAGAPKLEIRPPGP